MELVSLGWQSVYPPRLPSELPGYFLSYGDYATFIKQKFGQRRQLYFCFKQERQLRTGLSGGCLRSIAQRTRSGARSYWIGDVMSHSSFIIRRYFSFFLVTVLKKTPPNQLETDLVLCYDYSVLFIFVTYYEYAKERVWPCVDLNTSCWQCTFISTMPVQILVFAGYLMKLISGVDVFYCNDLCSSVEVYCMINCM